MLNCAMMMTMTIMMRGGEEISFLDRVSKFFNYLISFNQ